MMHLVLIAYIFFFAAATVPNEINAFNENRIVGGNDAPYGTFMFLPYLILHYPDIPQIFPMKTFDFDTCSSTIISNRHILTAAHCLIDAEKVMNRREHRRLQRHVNYIVDYRPEKEDFPFKLNKHAMSSRAYIHTGYNPINFLNDLAIIEFPDTANIIDSDFKPITLINNYEPKAGDHAVAAGYGLNNTKGLGMFPDKLQNATVPIFDSPETCIIRKSHHICTGEEKLRALHGDSGGPLMINQNDTFYQIGIASFTTDHKGVGRTFYIPLSEHCEWIEKVTKNEVKCKPLPASTPPGPPPPPAPTTLPSTTSETENNNNPQEQPNGNEFIKLNVYTLIFVCFIIIGFL